MSWKILSAAVLILACAPLRAQDDTATSRKSDAPLFEVTPFAGLRFGGKFEVDDPSRKLDLDDAGAFGVALDLRIDDVSQYELFFSTQSTELERDPVLGKLDMDVRYLHIGGTLAVDDAKRVIPYMAGGLGATRFSPSAGDGHDKTRFSLSLAAGLKVPFNEHFALRFEGRGYLTFIDTDTSFFCVSDGGAVCAIRGSGSTFIQWDLLAGASFAF